MRNYPFPDKKIWKCLEVLFLFAMLLLARDTLFTSCILGFYKSQFLMLGLMALAGLAFLVCQRKHLKEILTDPRMLLLVLSTVVLLVPMVVKRDWQIMYFSILLCLYFGVFLSYFLTVKQVSRIYVGLLCGLGVYSVIATYLLRLLPDSGLLNVPVFVNSADKDFYNFGLSAVSIRIIKFRNTGIFREPGVYQFFILLALLVNNYMADWEKSRTLWIANGILAVTMLSTFATGGVIEMGLLAVILFIDKKWYRDRRICTAAILLAVLGAVGVFVIVRQGGDLYVELAGMVTKFVTNPASTGDRVGAILVDAGIFLKHPLFGDDLGAVLHVMENNTTSTMLMFAIFGILGGVLHTASWAALVWDRNRKLLLNLGLLLVMFMSFNTQNIIADVFFWLLPIMALTEKSISFFIRRRLLQKG